VDDVLVVLRVIVVVNIVVVVVVGFVVVASRAPQRMRRKTQTATQAEKQQSAKNTYNIYIYINRA